jgi:hypothetical protein
MIISCHFSHTGHFVISCVLQFCHKGKVIFVGRYTSQVLAAKAIQQVGGRHTRNDDMPEPITFGWQKEAFWCAFRVFRVFRVFRMFRMSPCVPMCPRSAQSWAVVVVVGNTSFRICQRHLRDVSRS